MAKKKLGLIVNPVAGLGGRVGLKGSDGAEIQRLALDLGAVPQASNRAAQALARLWPLRAEFDLITYPGEMGEQAARAAGFQPAEYCSEGGAPRVGAARPGSCVVIGIISPGATTAEDTQRAARDIQRLGVDLLLFAGGDGTARDICGAVGQELTVLGIPAGVKIHSAAYAVSPAGAGDLAARVVAGEIAARREVEVMDVDEDALRLGLVSTRLYGYLLVPYHRRLIQGRKAPSDPGEAANMDGIAAAVVSRMERGVVYLLGPGTTLRAVAARLGVHKTLIGVDAVLDGELLAADANEAALLDLVRGRPARIIVTPIGGQGYLFGRGNQPLSPAVIRAAGKKNVIVVSTAAKVAALEGRPFLVDTGDLALDRALKGYVRVITGYDEEIVYRVSY